MINIKWMPLFLLLAATTDSSLAFNLAQKGRVAGTAIHTTYFLTPNNAAFDIQGTAMVGTWLNGTCVYASQINIGRDKLKSGDFVDLDAAQLKSLAGGGYSCVTFFYLYKQPVMDTMQLAWDGLNYTTTQPATSEVNIL